MLDCEDPDTNAFVNTKGKGKNDFEDPDANAFAFVNNKAVASRTSTPTPSPSSTTKGQWTQDFQGARCLHFCWSLSGKQDA